MNDRRQDPSQRGTAHDAAGGPGETPSPAQVHAPEPLLTAAAADGIEPSRLGPAKRVLFFGKSMSRSRCTGALVDSLRRHGVEVRWRNLVTWRRWFGMQIANRMARAEFRSYKPDVVFVFFRDLPLALASEFRKTARLVIWCEEPLESADSSIVDYFRLADIVCMSNPARFPWLREYGLDNMAFLMSGFSPRFHRPVQQKTRERPKPVRDVVFIGSPGRHGQRAALLAEISKHFDTEVFGGHWERWGAAFPRLRTNRSINNRAYAKVCATSRIVLGVNEVNDDEFYFSNRTFLTLACRAFHLTHYVPKLENVFRDGEHLVWYRDEAEAIEKIAEWLPQEDERARIAAEGHTEVMMRHQYANRVARILYWLEVGLPRADDGALLAGGALPEPAAVRAPVDRPAR